jgi:amino acid transporter
MRRRTAEPQAGELPQTKKPFIRRFLGDGLLFYTVYAFLFVAFFNSGTNSLQIGRQILIAINPAGPFNTHLMRFIAIVALSILCLLQYFSPKWGRKLNNFLALLKILSLLIVLFAGAHKTYNGEYVGNGNGFESRAPCEQSKSGIEVAKAMLLIIFSFEGWENATFVWPFP